MKESDLKRQILQYLKLKYPEGIFWNQRTTGIKKPNGHWIPSALPGVSDILGCWRGWFIAIEVKLPGNKPTPIQSLFLKAINDAGGLGIIAYSVEDVMENLARNEMVTE